MSSKKTSVCVGADPEVFIYNTKKKIFVPSCGLIGGNKGAGVAFTSVLKEATWLEDNVAVELNYTQQTTASGMRALTTRVMEQARVALQVKLGPEFTFMVSPEASFDAELLHSLKGAMTIGCEPDMYAYNYPNIHRAPLEISRLGAKRYAGGHVHISFNNKEKVPGYAVAMLCDVLIGLPSVVLDKQAGRREFYGRAGLYREKPYGIEYRTPSNWWLNEVHRNSREMMFDNALWLGRALEQQPRLLSNFFSVMPWEQVKKAIEEEDNKLAAAALRIAWDLLSNNVAQYMGMPAFLHSWGDM